MKVFHTFGDSHGSWHASYWTIIKVPGLTFKQTELAGKLAYSIGRDGLSLLNIQNHGVGEGDAVCFCFGEIDCRNHVYKHIRSDYSYKDVINEIVEKYVNTIKLNVEQYENLDVFIYNVVPPSHYRREDPGHPFPYLGKDEERKTYYLYMNERLKMKCSELGYTFFDVYEKYCNKDGFLDERYSDKICHIKDPIFAIEFLKNHYKL